MATLTISQLPMPQATYLENNYNEMFRQTRNTTFNTTEWCWAVQLNNFIPVLTDLEAATQYILKIIRCLCKVHYLCGRCGS